MKIRALKAFTIRDSETGNLTSIACGGIAEVSDTVGTSLISDGLAEAYTLVNPTGSVNITNNGTVDVAEYATAVVNVPGVTPTGTIEITSNGTVDVTEYATAEVNVDYTTVNFNLSESIKKTTTALSRPRKELAATTVAPAVDSDPQSWYALFAGGYDNGDFSTLVDAYDSRLTKTTTPASLSDGKTNLAATALAPTGGSDPQSGHALFGGGWTSWVNSAVVNAYDSRLTKTTPTALSEGRSYLAATTVAPALDSDPQSEHALFAGGRDGEAYSAVIDAYDSRLTRTTVPQPLSEGRGYLAATTVAPAVDSDQQSRYALFAGGYYSDVSGVYSAAVDAYDSRLTKTTVPQPLSEGRDELAATTLAPAVGSGYALFGGGYNYGTHTYFSVVDAYDSRLTRTTVPHPLSEARRKLAATTVTLTGSSEYALFAGGYYYDVTDVISAAVDVYDSSLTKTTATPLSQARDELAATTLATTGGYGYALFGGGGNYSTNFCSSVVDVYGPPNYKVQVFPETKYSFNGSEELVSDTWQEINISGSLIGYIKIKSTNVVG